MVVVKISYFVACGSVDASGSNNRNRSKDKYQIMCGKAGWVSTIVLTFIH